MGLLLTSLLPETSDGARLPSRAQSDGYRIAVLLLPSRSDGPACRHEFCLAPATHFFKGTLNL